MKKLNYLLFFAALSFCVSNCKVQQKIVYKNDCSTLHLDLEKGLLNNTNPSVGLEEMKAAFTCFTGETEEGSDFNCGGGLFFLNHGFFCYTHRDYIEARDDFQGTISPIGIGSHLSEVEEHFGKADKQPDSYTYLYKMKYGTLRIEFNEDFVNQVGIHNKSLEEIEFCR